MPPHPLRRFLGMRVCRSLIARTTDRSLVGKRIGPFSLGFRVWGCVLAVHMIFMYSVSISVRIKISVACVRPSNSCIRCLYVRWGCVLAFIGISIIILLGISVYTLWCLVSWLGLRMPYVWGCVLAFHMIFHVFCFDFCAD